MPGFLFRNGLLGAVLSVALSTARSLIVLALQRLALGIDDLAAIVYGAVTVLLVALTGVVINRARPKPPSGTPRQPAVCSCCCSM